jgi:uncharacterized membrane protein
MKLSKTSGVTIAVAAAALLLGGATLSPAQSAEKKMQEPVKVKCFGLNSCKGKGSCKTAMNECKGKNSCQGKASCK